MAHSRLWSLWAYRAFILVCFYASLKEKKNKREVTPYHDVSILAWHKNISTEHTIQIINFEVTTTQTFSLCLAENVSTQKKRGKKPSCLKLCTLSSVALHVWHWQAFCLCALQAQDQQRRRRNHPVRWQAAAVGLVTCRRAAAVTLKCTKA